MRKPVRGKLLFKYGSASQLILGKFPLVNSGLITRYAKTLLGGKGAPASWWVLLSSTLTLVMIIYSSAFSFSWYSLGLEVIYKPGYLEVLSYTPGNPEAVQRRIQPGDHIVALDEIPINRFMAADTGSTASTASTKIIFYPTQAGLSEFVAPGKQLQPSFKLGQTLLLWSVQATTLTLDVSERTNGKSVAQTDNLKYNNANPEVIKLNLLELTEGGWPSPTPLTLVLAFVALSFWASGLFLYLLKPAHAITFTFNQFCNAVALSIVISTSSNYQLGTLEKLGTIYATGVLGLSFYHFVLLFPNDQKPVSRLPRLSLQVFYLLSGLVISARFYFTFVVDAVSTEYIQLATPEPTIRKFNSLLWVGLLALALVVLMIKFYRSRGQDRVKLQLAVFSIFFALTPPLILILGYNLFGWGQTLLFHYIGFFCLPASVMPPAFTYAVVKHQLLGVSLAVRRFVEYLLITSMIVAGYFILSTLLSTVLHSGQALNQEGALLLTLGLSMLMLLLDRFRHQLHKFVDRAFRVDPLNYATLNSSWNDRLVKTNELPLLFDTVMRELPIDYRYNDVQLLICDANILQILFANEEEPTFSFEIKKSYKTKVLFEQHSEKVVTKHNNSQASYSNIGGDTTGLLFSANFFEDTSSSFSQAKSLRSSIPIPNISDTSGYVDGGSAFNIDRNLRENPAASSTINYSSVELDVEFWSQLRNHKYVLTRDKQLSDALKQGLTELSPLEIEIALPLQVGNEYYGAMLLGQKANEYFPTTEELRHLGILANQIAVSIHNAAQLAQATQLAQDELKFRQMLQQKILDVQLTREDERRKLGEVLHGDIIQDVSNIQRQVGDFRQDSSIRSDSEAEADILDYVYSSLAQVNTKLRTIIADFSLIEVRHLIIELRRLFAEFGLRYNLIQFSFEFEGDERLLEEKLLEVETKTALYRVIQEAVQNAVKHAQATQIRTTLEVTPLPLMTVSGERGDSAQDSYLIQARIVDDGLGIDPTILNKVNQRKIVKHFGISFMRWRLEKYQGELNFSPAENGSGTQVTASLVLKAPSAQQTSPLDELLERYGWQ